MKRMHGVSIITLVISIIIVIILATVIFFNISKTNIYDSSKIAKLVQQRDNLNSTSLLYISKVNSSMVDIYSNKEIILGKVDNFSGVVTDYNIILKGMNLYVVDEEKLKYTYDIKLPKISNKENAKWYIDIATGNFYLIYDSAEYYERYYGEYDKETEELKNGNLSSFVMTKKGFLWGEGMVPSASGIKIEMSNKDWTNKDITLTLRDIPDDVVLTEYLLPRTQEWVKYEDKITVPENGVVTIKVTNKFGNDDVKTIIIDKIDKLIPNNIKFTPNSAENVKKVIVVIDDIDDEEETQKYGKSGIKEIKYVWTLENSPLNEEDTIWNTADIIKNGTAIEREGITQTNYIQVLVEDVAGNKKVFVSGAYVIDNTPPNANQITAILSPNAWTNQNITVILTNLPTDAVVVQYTLPGSNVWNNYNGVFSVNSNGNVNVRVEDVAGNEAVKTILIEKIDKLAPQSVSFSPNSSSATKSVTVEITAQDALANSTSGNSGIKSIKYQWKTTNTLIDVTDSSWNSAGLVVNGKTVIRNGVTETDYLQVLVEDNAGNKKVFASSSYVIDNTPPNVNVITATMSPNTWTNSDVTVTLNNIPDDATLKQYKLPGSNAWVNYTGSFKIAQNGTITVRMQDIAGNEATKTIIVDKIDKLIPTSLSLSPNSSSATKSVTVKVTGQDALANSTSGSSGIKSIKYQWKTTNTLIAITDSSWSSASTITNGGSITKNAVTQTNYLHVLLEDNAGNKKSFVSGAYVIDNTAPNANAITATLSPNTWTNQNVSVTLGNIPSDATLKQYKLPGSSTWVNYTGAFSVASNGSVNVRVQDAAGNESTKTILINKIDKLVPSSIALSPNSSGGASTITVKITATDAAANTTSGSSGIAEVKYQWRTTNTALAATDSSWNNASTIVNGTSINKSGAGMVYLHVRAKDNAGNYKVVVSSTYILHTHTDSCYVHKHTSSCYTTHYHSSSCYTYQTYQITCPTCNGTGRRACNGSTTSTQRDYTHGVTPCDCGSYRDGGHDILVSCSTCGSSMVTYKWWGACPGCGKGGASQNCGTFSHSTISCPTTVTSGSNVLTCGRSNGTSYLTCGRSENLSYNCGY